ncbi:BTB/POZ and MATH domain-containing protein 1 [Brachypodium distachyon]|uniref:BTB domain-containing protein n=1 Tax=Brachypodium distachyon TaxID=15368 RepID=I1IK51_BRADI|nr:BTB/POZ and MATH domain-containing protein 1 [Brachypodium distachyon]KQJ87664.1 hypothetical protein BRADI_4g12820v3 [Brachypodium distachyon]|eukprot:XP_010239062.1 BTB/POZ and MATH domain-containing protein 1 [Brachypodium distachyon]
MSISELLSALRDAGRQHLSASTVGTRQATGSHLLQIENYAQIKKQLSVGEYVKSSTFTVGGHDWRVELYPKGCVREAHGHVSLFLRRVCDAKTGGRDDSATAKIEFSLLDGATGEPSLTKSSPPRTFKPGDEDWGWREFVNKDDGLEDEKTCLGQDGCLRVLCDVSVDLGIRADDATPEPETTGLFPAAPSFELRGELAGVIWNARRPDVRVEVGGEALAAHRWMLAPRSPVFAAELSRTFQKNPAVLRVEDMDADVCRALLEFIYTGALHDMDRKLESSMAEKLLVAADRYGVEQLKELCEKAVCGRVGMSSVAASLALAKRHGCPLLRDACLEFLSAPGNLEAVVEMDGFEELMQEGCPSGLTKLIVKQVRRHEQWSPFSG